MRYLFVVQGEGRGHLTQAISMYDMLTRNGHEVVEVLVGKNKSLTLPAFFYDKIQCPVSAFNSPHFIFSDKSKKSLLFKSIFYNLSKTLTYIKSMRFIKKRINEAKVDMVINFYEILTGLTYALSPPRVPYICIAHQYLLLHPDFRFPRKSKIELNGLLFFTRLTCFRTSKLLALSFRKMSDTKRIKVVPPLIRKEVLQKKPQKGNYILGYMVNAGFSEQIIEWHKQNPEIALHCFWDKQDVPKAYKIDDTLTFHQLDDVKFLDYMAGCEGYASTGGFESICEAMYLQKPVMMVPAHIEQECNAFDAAISGAGVSSPVFDLTYLINFMPSYVPNNDFANWVNNSEQLFLNQLDRKG